MTDTTDTQDTSAGEHHPVGTLEHIDPHVLVVDTNVRDDAAVDAQFVASIKEHGVLAPILGVRTDDGSIRVRAGQRRTLAAREAGLTTVPVYVRAATGGDENTQLAQRAAEQIVENDHRSDITDAQRALGIQQMLNAGLSVTKVAKKLAVAKDTIKAAESAAKSSTAMAALDGGQLSLTEAATITEFEDMAGAVERLLDVAGTPRFEHAVAQLRKDRASAEAEAQAAQGWTERGFTVLEQRPETWDQACIPLRYLVTAQGAEAGDNAVSDPAHWAVLLYEDTALCDVETGDIVDEDSVDWDTEDQPDAAPADELRHAKTVTDTTVFAPEYYCLDYRAAGLTVEQWFARRAGMLDADTDEAVNLDEEAREAARQQAEAERADTEKRERRKVLALNRLGDAAMLVRREFVAKLLTRKTPPKGAAIFVARVLARDSHLLSDHNALDTTAALLGLDSREAVAKLVAELPPTGDGRAQVITLALVLGALENRTPKDAWRTSTPSWNHHVGSDQYLGWLADNDYPLAAIEEVITKAKTADEIYDKYLADAGKE
ncbi:nuclease [Mycobacterium lentiflavum]|uniref:Nuclease n=1 Tax=Mycobacterium lentiflavum TaxID=141349 RepID=A0A0E3WEA7_MYCLN|nr:ParB N-terminal domain-containing protein [Mycobacterium lentiflavum]CQD24287.1 nuclease [Mycobacterium lentiflavum]